MANRVTTRRDAAHETPRQHQRVTRHLHAPVTP
jgi:hypothetical protein